VSDNWGYVVAGYALTAGTLAAYATWIKLRTRRLKRLLSDEGRD
jgi:hypothetical protein